MGTGYQYTYWQEPDGKWLGYINDYPDYMTEGETLDELRLNLADILSDLVGGLVPCVRRTEELVLA